MAFSSVIFLFFFLPAVITLYYLSPRPLKNLILLAFSLLFYAWGEGIYVLLMVLSIGVNYSLGLALHRTQNQPRRRQMALWGAIIFNLGALGYYKYAGFLSENINTLLGTNLLKTQDIHLPIGISFFTFQAMSYVIDVYRGTTEVQKNPFRLALFISLFPQLIAGPIVRYQDIADQLGRRRFDLENVAGGVRRFSYGLAKKVLIANVAGQMADQIFATPTNQMGTGLVWLGVICYALQIFFDFSGYSDMTIGLGHIFGFTFPENFDTPYIARSIREFWRRWHITLSTWFRDYLYIPLGGNQRGVYRTYLNLYIVFFLTGLWHGASWNFVIWGLIHGTAMVIERLGFGALLERVWRPLQHLYTLLVVLVAWVFFRAEELDYALAYIGRMFSFTPENPVYHARYYLDNELILVLILGTVFSMPVVRWLEIGLNQRVLKHRPILTTATRDVFIPTLQSAVSIGLLALSTIYVTSSAYNPFIYFRF
jgi:alginate O-acetyltransferase complex protein AlgI